MKMSNAEYAALIQERMPKSPFWKDVALAFLIGGGLCCLGQAVSDLFRSLGLGRESAAGWTSVSMIFRPIPFP